MKAFKILALAALAAAPVLSFAQSSEPVTRAQVRAELVQLEQAGYRPAAVETQYPSDIQAAEARVSANQVAQSAVSSSYGGVVDTSSASGSHHHRDTTAAHSSQDDIPGLGPIYAHS
jgi:activator of HSP90 ATPase